MSNAAIMTLDDATPPDRKLHLHEIKKAVCAVYGVSRRELDSHLRPRNICDARHVYFWIARKFTTFSYPMIARHCGDRDHSTAMHGALKVDLLFPDYCDRIALVLKRLDINSEVTA